MKMIMKQDLNFLEYPMWSTSKIECELSKIYIFRDGDYIYKCTEGQPKSFDIKFLNFLLLLSQESGFCNKISFNMHSALKTMNAKVNGGRYNRIRKSLRIWKNINISFKKFYLDGEYPSIEFNIINEYVAIEGTKTIEVELNKRWLNQIKESKFFKNLNMNIYMKITKPFTLRMFEIFEKNLAFRNSFKIKTITLLKKIWTDEELKKYRRKVFPSDIIKRILIAIEEINKYIKVNRQEKYYIEMNIFGKGKLSSLTFYKQTIPQEKNKKQADLNLDSTEKHPEVAKWMRSKHVSESKVQHILTTCGNISHVFLHIKSNYDDKKHKPGWIVSAFQNNFYGNFPPYDEYKKAEDNGFDFDDWVKCSS